MVYEFRQGSRLSGNPQVVGETLECIRERDGAITPSAVVTESEPEASPLHEYFEWDDTAAANKHREEQARGLIRSVIAVEAPYPELNERVKNVRAFLNVVINDEKVYESTRVVMANPVLKDQVLRNVRTELANLRHKIEELEDFSELVGGFKQLQLRISETLETMPKAA